MKLKEAIQKANYVKDLAYTMDKGFKLKGTIDEVSGFLTAPVTLARIGVQEYMGFELGLADRAMEKIGVLRSAEEVFNQESIDSFINLVATNNHPKIPVHIGNVKGLQVGQVSSVEKTDETTISGIATITDKNMIKDIQSGKREVSVGYTHDLLPEVGTFNGEKYEFVQKNIRANHLAIVDAGRCGAACKLTLDNKKELKMKVTIDGITYDTEDEQLAQAIKKQQKTHDAEKKKLADELEEEKKKKEEEGKEKEKAMASKDVAVKELENYKKNQLTDDAIGELVSKQAELLATATSILGKDAMPECGNCPKEIKSAVVDKVLGLDMSGKPEDYIDASYDIAVKKITDQADNFKGFKQDFEKFKTNDSITTSRDGARNDYMKEQGFHVPE